MTEATIQDKTMTATFAGGCFWCMEPPFKDLKGVTSVTVGYTGGHKANPTYEEVCTGTTGHAEAIQVVYDPAQISYQKLLETFWHNIDPTSMNAQFADHGTQYRSAIFTHSDAQRQTAEAVKQEITAAKIWHAPLVTEIVPFQAFYEAEEEHHDYFARNPWSGYCQVVVAPKVAKFRKQFTDRLKRAAAE